MRFRKYIRLLPIYGCISTGIIYLSVGVIAILSFLRIKRGGADESSLLAFLNEYFAGRLLVWIILLGTVCYILWRIFESIRDPYAYGKSAKGIALRSGIALSTIADALIASAAIQVLFGNSDIQKDGQPVQERQMVANVLNETWGRWVVIGIGGVMLVTAVVQMIYGLTEGYKERQDIDHMSKVKRRIIHFLANYGYLARGIILGIIGFFFLKAGIMENERYVVNTDKAFDFIGDDVGHAYFILVAIGTACYGLFMFVLGATYDVDKD